MKTYKSMIEWPMTQPTVKKKKSYHDDFHLYLPTY